LKAAPTPLQRAGLLAEVGAGAQLAAAYPVGGVGKPGQRRQDKTARPERPRPQRQQQAKQDANQIVPGRRLQIG